jgi:hypothetical protein
MRRWWNKLLMRVGLRPRLVSVHLCTEEHVGAHLQEIAEGRLELMREGLLPSELPWDEEIKRAINDR